MEPRRGNPVPYGTPAPLSPRFRWDQVAEAAAPITTGVAQKPLPVAVPKYKGAARDATMFNPGGARMDDIVGTLLLTLAVNPTLDLAESARRVMHDVGTGIGANKETPQAGFGDVVNLATAVLPGVPHSYPKVKIGDVVEGLTVGEHVPNYGSLASSGINNVLPGIRRVPVSSFVSLAPRDMFYAADDIRRVRELAQIIANNKRIDPLIVAVDREGNYILEGAHRAAALHQMGVKEFPAVIGIEPDAF